MGGCGTRCLDRDLSLGLIFCSCRTFPLDELDFSNAKIVNYVFIQTWFVKLKVKSYVYSLYFLNMCRACTICAHLRVGLSVMFRSGRGLRKDRQIKPLS